MLHAAWRPKRLKKSTGDTGAFVKLHRGVQGLLLVLAVSSASFQAWSWQTSQLLSGLRCHAMYPPCAVCGIRTNPLPHQRAASSAIHCAAFSAIISVGELVLPDVIRGITEASITRRRPTPRTRSRSSTTAA